MDKYYKQYLHHSPQMPWYRPQYDILQTNQNSRITNQNTSLPALQHSSIGFKAQSSDRDTERFNRFKEKPFQQYVNSKPSLGDSIVKKNGHLKRTDLGWDSVKLSEYVTNQLGSKNYIQNEKIIAKFKRQADQLKRANRHTSKNRTNQLDNNYSYLEQLNIGNINIPQKKSFPLIRRSKVQPQSHQPQSRLIFSEDKKLQKVKQQTSQSEYEEQIIQIPCRDIGVNTTLRTFQSLGGVRKLQHNKKLENKYLKLKEKMHSIEKQQIKKLEENTEKFEVLKNMLNDLSNKLKINNSKLAVANIQQAQGHYDNQPKTAKSKQQTPRSIATRYKTEYQDLPDYSAYSGSKPKLYHDIQPIPLVLQRNSLNEPKVVYTTKMSNRINTQQPCSKIAQKLKLLKNHRKRLYS